MYRSALPLFLSLFILACSSEGTDGTTTADSAETGHDTGFVTSTENEDAGNGNGYGYAIVADSIIRTEKRPRYEVQAIFPQLSGMEEGTTGQRFNGTIRDSVQRMVEEFISWVDETDEELPLPGDDEMYSAFELSYETFLKNERGVSIGLENYTNYRGAAHPNAYTTSILFDLKIGRFLELGDLFRTNVSYLDTIAAICTAELIDLEVSDEGWIREGAGPVAENYGTFFVTSDSLLIHFNTYQVAPHAAGPQRVGIPWQRLKGLLDPNGIAGTLKAR